MPPNIGTSPFFPLYFIWTSPGLYPVSLKLPPRAEAFSVLDLPPLLDCSLVVTMQISRQVPIQESTVSAWTYTWIVSALHLVPPLSVPCIYTCVPWPSATTDCSSLITGTLDFSRLSVVSIRSSVVVPPLPFASVIRFPASLGPAVCRR